MAGERPHKLPLPAPVAQPRAASPDDSPAPPSISKHRGSSTLPRPPLSTSPDPQSVAAAASPPPISANPNPRPLPPNPAAVKAAQQAAEIERLQQRVRALEAENEALRGGSPMPTVSGDAETVQKLMAERTKLLEENSRLTTELNRWREKGFTASPMRGPSRSIPNNPSLSPSTAEATNESKTESKVKEKTMAIEFTEDSPFFRSKLTRSETVANNLGNRLKNVTKTAGEFCQHGQSFAQACGNLGTDLLADWSDVEKSGDSNVLSLANSMSKLGDLLIAVRQITTHLVLTCDALLVQNLFDFRQKHIKGFKETSRVLEKATEEYDSMLTSFLQQKLPGSKGTGSSFFARVRGKTSDSGVVSEQEIQEQLANLRRRFELARFDHLRTLNELHTERILDIVEVVCAAYLAFCTFFHEGQYQTEQTKPEIDSMNGGIQSQRAKYAQVGKHFTDQRAKLERGLASANFSISDAFPSTVDEQELARQFVTKGGKTVRVEKQGYLFKQSSNIKKDWKRRWFALQEGQLFYFRSEEDLEPQHIVDAILCSVREVANPELRFCFELISPNKRAYILQAESEKEMQEWISVFQNCTEMQLAAQSGAGSSGHSKRMSMASLQRYQDDTSELIAEIRNMNSVCVDCGARDPEWASINLGVLMCIECSGIHRSLGVHISKVRSLTLDTWEMALLMAMKRLGNSRFNALMEHSLHEEFPKPKTSTSRDDKDAFIRAKYVAKLFMNKQAVDASLTADQLGQALYDAAGEAEFEDILALLAFGADVNWQNAENDNRTPLHNACEFGHVAVVEFLCQNGAKLSLTDANGKTPLDVAVSNNFSDIQKLIVQKNKN